MNDNSITVKLWGGLGNQLFQYAYAYALSKKTNSELLLDTSWFETQNLREPDILKLNIENKAVNTWKENKKVAFLNRKFPNRFIRLPKFAKYKIGDLVYLKESRFKYSKSIHDFSEPNAYLDGYWQCPVYFSEYISDFQKLYKPRHISEEISKIAEELRNSESVAIHVRRGDYPRKKKLFSRLAIINDSYYKTAVDYFKSKKPNATYYLFSDDIPEAKECLFGCLTENEMQTIELPNLTALEEWYLMRCCANQIIGNSTFSWWSAYLNENPDKIVCAPSDSMGNDDIIPDDWVQFSS